MVTREPHTLLDASKVVLPGVGAFADCMRNLEEYGLIDAVLKSIAAGKPFLGICLGLQLLFTESEEFGISKGLDIIKGRVIRFKGAEFKDLKIPHMGWNSASIKRRPPAMADVPDNNYSTSCTPSMSSRKTKAWSPQQRTTAVDFISSIWKDNIFAVQFHPEKSQALGLSILKRFGEMKS